ncbi:MAG: hypothetical protein A2033_04085 [Bacteroidetes bacterium GWA2_31_9]|nr:MAG: hypothetical protein A2033_04085 [Bacteroidetes bacterium GWA2_31_9]
MKEYRRNLPHINKANAVYFITTRLANTLPKSILDAYIKEKDFILKKNPEADINSIFEKHIQNYLDRIDNSINWLINSQVAEIVENAIKFHDNTSYSLIAYCIMPNHIHYIIDTDNFTYQPLYKIQKSINNFSSREANKILERTGQFWHHESYDHIIKTQNELADTISYVINNPVKAGLVKDWKEWKHTFVNEKYLDIP